jgi:hypothetical protein
VDPFPDPLLLRKSVGAGNRTRTSGSVARNTEKRGGHILLRRITLANKIFNIIKKRKSEMLSLKGLHKVPNSSFVFHYIEVQCKIF